MMRATARLLALATVGATTSIGGVAIAQAPAKAPSESAAPELEKERLQNGLRLVMNVDRTVATVAICTTFDFGMNAETEDTAGMLTIVNRLLLAGRRTPTGTDAVALVHARGGRVSSHIQSDTASHCVELPAHSIAVGFWLEAERLKPHSLVKTGFDGRAKKVIEELSAALDAEPYGRAALRVQELVFQGMPGYSNTPLAAVRGSPPDYDAARDFHRSSFTVSRGVLTISGDIDPPTVRALAGEHFGALSASDTSSTAPPTGKLRQTSERYAAVEDEHISSPGLFWGWPGPPKDSDEHAALLVATEILAGGAGASLSRRLVDRDLATATRPLHAELEKYSLVGFQILLTKGAMVRKAEAVLHEEVARLKRRGPTAAELARAKRRIHLRRLLGLESNLDKALAIGRYEALGRKDSPWELARIDAVTIAAIREAVARTLAPVRRTTVEAHLPLPPAGKVPTTRKRIHIVQSGESLIGIAKRYGVDVGHLVTKNGIDPKKAIHPGQKLVIVGGKPKKKPRVHVVKKGEALSIIAKRYGVSVRALTGANGLSKQKPIRPGQQLIVPEKSP